MIEPFCRFCLQHGHLKSDCPRVGVIRVATEHGVIDPMTADEPMDVLALRCFALRAFARGLLADLHAAGLQPSEATLALAPEHDTFDP